MTPLPKLCPRDVDMSPEAIEQRLREVSELAYLCAKLASAKRLGAVNDIRERAAEDVSQAPPRPDCKSTRSDST